MKIIFIRHSESTGNKKGIIQGHKNFGLTKKGKEQAFQFAKKFKNKKIDVIYSSDLKRAAETAKIIKKHHKESPIYFLKILRERNLGCLEGKKRNSVNYKKFINKRPPGGESFSEVKKRAQTFLKYLLQKYSKETILVITHSGFIRMIYGIVAKKTIKECCKEIPFGSLKNNIMLEIEVLSRKKQMEIFKIKNFY